MKAMIRGHSIAVAAPVFLADMDHTSARLRLHVRRGIDVADVQARAQAALDTAGQPIEVVVRAHDLRSLAFPRSLEHWLGRFQLGEVVYDPTMIVGRARALLRGAKACRAGLAGKVRGIFFDPGRRSLFVLIKGQGGADLATREQVRSLVDAAWSPEAAEAADSVATPPRVNVQAVTSLPRGEVVPVDNKSASLARRLGSEVRRWLAPLALALAAAAIAGPATAKTDGRLPGLAGDARTASKSATVPAEFGVLSGLSVFADGQRRFELDAFASSGLHMFFGSTIHRTQGVQVAQGNVLRRAELSDTDTGTASGQPGS
ncbi:MAG: hypothetical protein KIT36_06095 [Alphaproteobacteria bacterium]|nr:hypothetical protein [Alphaproteobacteria bacterium]